MVLVVADRVQETTLTTGTSDYALFGAVTGFQSFGAVMANGDTTYYAVTDGTNWEVGIGTYSTTGPTMARTTILSSNNSGNIVNWPAGTKEIFLSYPASKSSYLDASGALLVADKIVHTGNTDTTVRFPAANTVSIETGGVERFKVENSTITTTVPIALPADPTLALQAATKQYVDTLAASGIHFHQPVRVESPVNLNATYNNGASGVGATLTNAGAQAALVIDGVTVATNDRVLVYQQTTQTQNGIYVVTDTGSGSTNWVLTRSSDANTYVINSANGLSEGSTVFVQEGTTGAGETYTCNTSGVITFGTTNITFAQISSAQIYSAGSGLALTGTVFSNTAPDQIVTLTQSGATTITGTYPNFTISSANTNYTAGGGIGLTDTTFSVAAGSGLTQDTDGLSHADTSSQGSVDNTGATFIQDVTLDGFGHVTALASTTVTPSLIGAPQTDGTGASGTWAISISGTSANTTSISSAVGTGFTWTGQQFFQSNQNTSSGTNTAPLQAYSTGGNGAIMAFHRSGTYAINMGLDSDNVFRIGGWSASANRLQMDMSGNLTMAGNVTAYSDSRLKKDLEPITDALEKVQSLTGYTYTRIDSGERHTGLIAQDVQSVLPEAVMDDGDRLSLAYGNMVGLLVEAIKAQQVQIDELKSKLGV